MGLMLADALSLALVPENGPLPWRWARRLGPCAPPPMCVCRGAAFRGTWPRERESPVGTVGSCLEESLLPLLTSSLHCLPLLISQSPWVASVFIQFSAVIRVEKAAVGLVHLGSLCCLVLLSVRSFYFHLHPRRVLGQLWVLSRLEVTGHCSGFRVSQKKSAVDLTVAPLGEMLVFPWLS